MNRKMHKGVTGFREGDTVYSYLGYTGKVTKVRDGGRRITVNYGGGLVTRHASCWSHVPVKTYKELTQPGARP